MDSIQPPQRFLPDIVSPQQETSQQLMSLDTQHKKAMPTTTTICSNGDTTNSTSTTNITQMPMQTDSDMVTDCPTSAPDSAIHSTWTPATPIEQYFSLAPMDSPPPRPPLLPPPISHHQQQQQHYTAGLPPPPPPRQHHHHHQQPQQQQQQFYVAPPLPDIDAKQTIQEFDDILRDTTDRVVLTNSVCLLFSFSIDNVRGEEFCQAMSDSPNLMSTLFSIINNQYFHIDQEADSLILSYATGNLANISKYEQGRNALLNYDPELRRFCAGQGISSGVQALFRSLQSKNANDIIFAITAIHNLLLDGRIEAQELAKEQLKHGLKYIVDLLDHRCPLNSNYEFKVIVMACLHILAYMNPENRLAIKACHGPNLILRTIEQSNHLMLQQLNPDCSLYELIETGLRVLKSLSGCIHNKEDIIKSDGIRVLTEFITDLRDRSMLSTCLWTLRNLSDLINKCSDNYVDCIKLLVGRLLEILEECPECPEITTFALGILANLTCNNDTVKQYICENCGIDRLLASIRIAVLENRDFEPAVLTLCHLMTQVGNPHLVEQTRGAILQYWPLFNRSAFMSQDLVEAINKLDDKLNMHLMR